MNIGRLISSSERQVGTVLRLPCTQCDKPQWFCLKTHTAAMRLLGVEFSKSTVHSLHCTVCDYPIDVSAADAQRLTAFLPIAEEFRRGIVDEATYEARVKSAGFKFLTIHDAINTYWKCGNCGEESPLTITDCWSCGTSRPESAPQDDGTPPSTPYLNRVMDRDVGPLGPVKL